MAIIDIKKNDILVANGGIDVDLSFNLLESEWEIEKQRMTVFSYWSNLFVNFYFPLLFVL